MTDTRDGSEPYGDKAARRTAELAARTDRMLAARTGGPFLLAPMAATAVALLGLWLWIADPVLSNPFSGAGWDTSLRDEMVSVPIILSGLVLVRRPRSTVAAAIAVACGLGLVAFGLWADHDMQRTVVNELVTGFAVVVGALAARLSGRD